MCRDCGCSLGPAATRAPLAAPAGVAGKIETIEVITAILGENDAWPRTTASISTGTACSRINLMSSPGAGKTALLEATITRARRAACASP